MEKLKNSSRTDFFRTYNKIEKYLYMERVKKNNNIDEIISSPKKRIWGLLKIILFIVYINVCHRMETLSIYDKTIDLVNIIIYIHVYYWLNWLYWLNGIIGIENICGG